MKQFVHVRCAPVVIEKTPSPSLLNLAWIAATIVATQLPTTAAPLHLTFQNQISGKTLLTDSLRYQNSEKETFSITRLDYLATDFTLTTDTGKTITLSETAFIPTKGTTITLSNVLPRKYTSISFHIGPDKETNHSDPAKHPPSHPLNPDLNNLHWDWQGGYIFLAMEGHWRAPAEKLPGGYAYHFANDHNRTKISLPISVDLRNEIQIHIALDPQKLLTDISFQNQGTTTHSRPSDPIAALLKKNLRSAFRITSIHKGGVPTPPNPPAPIDLPENPEPYPITLPRHIPIPPLPTDNPLIAPRVALGEKLFHEKQLSANNSISCSSCHQGTTLSDPRKLSLGTQGKPGSRHAMPLFNLAWKSSFMWDGSAPSIRAQVMIPIQHHLEMNQTLEATVKKLKADPTYPPLFATAFRSGKISPENIGLALENFLLTSLSLDSKLDRSRKGKATLTAEEQHGFQLFFTESEPRMGRKGADCFHCHGGAHFTDHSFHNNGLTTTDDVGLESFTGKPEDRYKFATPSLRNIALTAPYMHDGRFSTLEEVINHYNEPIPLSETLDPNLAKHPQGLTLSEADQKAIIAFLKTLTDQSMK